MTGQVSENSSAVSLDDYVVPAGMVFQKTVIQELTTVLGKETHHLVTALLFVEKVIQKIVIPKSRIVVEGAQHQKVVIVTSMTVLFVMVSHPSSYLVPHFWVVQTGLTYPIIHVSLPTVALFPVLNVISLLLVLQPVEPLLVTR